MLRKIKLYGELAKFLGQKTFEAEVHNAAQAMRFLVVNFPQLENHMADRYYKIIVDKDWSLVNEELHHPIGLNEIKIVPVIGGAGGGAGRQILFGMAIIGISFMFPGAGAFATYGLGGKAAVVGGFFTKVGTLASYIGASMVLSGISTMLTPVETIPEDNQDPRRSFNFSGIQNTSRAGVAVPVIYGRVMVGSITVSANIENEQVEV